MAETWHQIWITFGSIVIAAMLFLRLQTYTKGSKPILFIGLYLFATMTVIAFALTDSTRPPSPATAYVIAVVTFVVVSICIGARGLSRSN